MFEKRWLLLALLLLLALPGRAEEPPRLSECQTVEQVEAIVLYPGEGGLPVPVEAGKIRYISQDTEKEPAFCAEYWYGGEPGSELDLTIEETPGHVRYSYYARNMCTRAVYSMALSYLGVDLTPGGMSAMLERRVVSAPYDETTDLLSGVERVTYRSFVFQNMYEAYSSGEGYSPVYLYFRRPNGVTHAVLVVAQREDGRYIVVDPKYHEVDGVPVHVYSMALSKDKRSIVNSDFGREQAGSVVLGYGQWRLVEPE